MSQINVNIDDDLDKQFRFKIIEVLGGRRGALKIAIEEAIKLWIASNVDENNLKK